MATNTLHIRVRSDGTRVVGRGIKTIGDRAKDAGRQVFLLKRAIRTLFAAAGLRGAVRMVNTYTEMNNKIKTVIKSEKLLVGTRKKLLASANKSRTSMDAIVQLYTRTTRAAKGLGKSENQLIQFTESLAKETVISGASSIEAANAIRQLTQGMGPAGLKGEELRSVLEQLPTVAQRIAAEMKVSTNELRRLGAEGKITGDIIIEAFLNAEKEIDENFKKTLLTLPQAMTVLKNNATEFFGELDEGLGISRALAGAIQNLAENIRGNLTTALQFAGAGAVVFIGAITKAAYMAAPFIALVLILKEVDSTIKRMTGGASGLGLVLQLAGENFQKLGVYIKSILDDLVKLISTLDGIPSLQEFVDGVALKEALNTPQARAAIRQDALQMTLSSQPFTKIKKENPKFQGIQLSDLDKMERENTGAFVESYKIFLDKNEMMLSPLFKGVEGAIVDLTMFLNKDLFNAIDQVQGKKRKLPETAEELAAARARDQETLKERREAARPRAERESPLRDTFRKMMEVAADNFRVRTLEDLEERTGTRSPSQAGVNAELERVTASRQVLDLQNKILITNRSLQGVAENAGEAQKEVAEALITQLYALQEGVEKLSPDNLQNFKTVLEETDQLLDSLQVTESRQTQESTLKESVQAEVAQFDKLLEAAKKISPEAEAAALSTIEEVATLADATILESAQRTADLILEAYQQVLAKVTALSGRVGIASSSGGSVGSTEDPLPGSEGIAPPPPDSNPNLGLEENNEKLKAILKTSRDINAEGPQAFKNMGASAKQFGDTAQNVGNEFQQAFGSIFSSLEDALVSFVTTGKLDFKSLINSIIADLARMLIQMLIIKPLMGFFGGFFGGIFGFSGGGSVGGAFGLPSFADGGLVNTDPSTPARFATGGLVHGPGTGVSDSVNALLSRDEFVVNAAASRPNMAGLEYLNRTGTMPGGGTVTSVAYSPNVSVTVEGNSANAAGDGARIAKDMEQQMRAQFNEFVSQEQRPGGAFSKTNEDVI